MNRPKDTLWDLVKSLTPAEKRYFKTHFASPNNRLTVLFDQVNSQPTYEEKPCRLALKVPARQFKVLKHQLQELILKSLVANHGKRNVKSKIRLGLEEVDLLLERELYADAIKRLRRLESLCERYGLTLYRYEVLERLHEVQHLELDFSDPEAALHYKRLVQMQHTLRQKQELSAIQLKLDDWNPFSEERNKVLITLREQLLSMQAEYFDFSGKLAWFQAFTICNELLGAEKEAARFRKVLLDYFEDTPVLQKEMPLSYLRVLQQLTSPGRQVLSLPYVEEIARKARKLIAQHPQYSPHYIYFLWARLQTRFLHHDWEGIRGQLEKDCLAHLATYQLGEFRTAVKMYILLSISCLVMADYKKALFYLEAYRNNKLKKDRWLDYGVNLLELILYQESNTFEKLASRLSYFRKQYKNVALTESSPLYALNLAFFNQMVKQPFEKDQLAMQVLLQIAEYPYDPLLYYYSFFNIERWVQSQGAKRTWRESIATKKVGGVHVL
ncbi:MAG: hypothetical protein AAGJ93_00700 [Bacteroidota bacterium]